MNKLILFFCVLASLFPSLLLDAVFSYFAIPQPQSNIIPSHVQLQ